MLISEPHTLGRVLQRSSEERHYTGKPPVTATQQMHGREVNFLLDASGAGLRNHTVFIRSTAGHANRADDLAA